MRAMSMKTRASSWVPVDLAKRARKYTVTPKKIKLLDQHFAYWYHDGKPRMAPDVCWHRGASLSAGGQVQENGCVKCKYHGLHTRSLSEADIVEKDEVVWVKLGENALSEEETTPPTSWEFHDDSVRVFSYSRSFQGCNPLLTVENTLDFSHLDTVHLFHLIEGRPEVEILDHGAHGKAIYKYKSKVIDLAIENEYIAPWSSCLRFMFDGKHGFTIHFTVVPHGVNDSTLLVRVSRPKDVYGGLGDLFLLGVNELPLVEDRYIVQNANPLAWSENRLLADDSFLSKYREYISANHFDLVSKLLK